jgi:glycosyltransferase involved in cell wall biosynthesis
MVKQKPFFSIIIPTLNEEKYLPHLLSDLSSQTFRDFEVIIVDGHSDDQTINVAKNYAKKLPKLTILTSPKRHVCVQRNLGASHAKSTILIFSDADNRLPSYFLQGIKYRWESSAVDILACWLAPDPVSAGNNVLASAMNLFLEIQNNVKPTYLMESMAIISKKCFSHIGGFDESMNYAEGKSIIQAANTLGYASKVIHDPLYGFSFRRFKKYGMLKVASHVAQLELSSLLGIDAVNLNAEKLYPMAGGKLFTQDKKVKTKFQKNIAKLMVYLKSSD